MGLWVLGGVALVALAGCVYCCCFVHRHLDEFQDDRHPW